MATELQIVWAGRHRRDRWEELVADYRERIRRTISVSERAVKVSARGSERERRREETRLLRRAIPSPSWTIALDRRGRQFDSPGLAEMLGRLIDEQPHPIVFLLGSDVGLSDEVLDSARQTLSFGRLTLPHELARLVLYEQLYRAVAIRSGINYHR